MEYNKTTNHLHRLLRAGMILFWVYVGMDKIWQLDAFRIALEQQPVISPLAPLLFWLLPVVEIGIGLLLAVPSRTLQVRGWQASTLLIAIFTLYIGLGVLDVYAQKPCMCTSFLSRISWGSHLLINVGLLGLSILGWKMRLSPMLKGSSTLAAGTDIALVLIGIVSIGILTYRSTPMARTDLWHLPDSLYQVPEHYNVSRPIVGSLTFRYDRYCGRYRQLFTRGMQASNFTNQLMACHTERRKRNAYQISKQLWLHDIRRSHDYRFLSI
ncbi:MauE/DoxX family redox-associated membrane protein [Sphingobacterium thalpophilum]|uniref:MauE/DoxX family redox-associated membrane protein n=1 Tax=Sphingobacterium thalpophilum TaxID=259 RepID=UPI0024A72F7C|nr:MauE/DoxX family redox-associated membrane protein [Sphingobacterium thalpophilum]